LQRTTYNYLNLFINFFDILPKIQLSIQISGRTSDIRPYRISSIRLLDCRISDRPDIRQNNILCIPIKNVLLICFIAIFIRYTVISDSGPAGPSLRTTQIKEGISIKAVCNVVNKKFCNSFYFINETIAISLAYGLRANYSRR
jgi:hypothetical protein